MKIRLQKSRPARETTGAGAGLGAASVLIWLADQVGLKIDPIVAGVIGGAITSLLSAFLRKQVMKP